MEAACWEASPVMTEVTPSPNQGNFYSGCMASVQNGENIFLLCALTQALVLVSWTVQGSGGISLLKQDRFPDTSNICSHSRWSISPPSIWGRVFVRLTYACRENSVLCVWSPTLSSVCQPQPQGLFSESPPPCLRWHLVGGHSSDPGCGQPGCPFGSGTVSCFDSSEKRHFVFLGL